MISIRIDHRPRPRKYLESSQFWPLGLVLISLVLPSCSKDSSIKSPKRSPNKLKVKPQTQLDQPPSPKPSPKLKPDDEILADDNQIKGSWKVRRFHDQNQEAANEADAIHQLLNTGNELKWKIGTETATFTFQSSDLAAAPCTATLEFDVFYCCPQMHRVFFMGAADGEPQWTQTPAGCLQNSAAGSPRELLQNLKQIGFFHGSYHFIKEENHLILMGPYFDTESPRERDNFTTLIYLVPN